MKVISKTKIIINLVPPFNFDSTFHKPDHFTSGDNIWQPGVRWQTWLWKDENLGLKFKNKGTREKPEIEVSIYSGKSLDKEFIDSLTDEIRYRYNLDLNLTGFYKEFEDDKALGPVIKKWRGMRPGHPSSLY